MLKLLKCVFIISILFSSGQSMAQLTVFGIKKDTQPVKEKSQHHAREEEVPLNLPFWDDFSFSDMQPSDTLWESSGVTVNTGLGITPPSLGVASFDGVTASGFGYGGSASSTGPTDSLTSLPIDLSALSVDSNVYISFFYQYAGNGDTPDPGDSIRLEFKTSDTTWVSVWPGSAQLDTTGNFVQVIQKVNNAAYFHDAFQFQFTSFGRQSGPFDVWNIDYVYLNKNRSADDLSFPDRTISTPMVSLFGEYTAIPYNHFDPSQIEYPTVNLYNLYVPETNAPSTYFYEIKGVLTHFLDSTVTHSPFDTLVGSPAPPLSPQAIQERQMEPFLNGISFNPMADSAKIEVDLVIDAGDNTKEDYDSAAYLPIDFRVNDSVRSTFILSSYYAHDDGTAEAAAGLSNGAGKSLAYQFDMVKDTTDYIVAVDIYFPFINSEPAGKEIDLTIWSAIDVGKPSPNNTTVIHRENAIVRRDPAFNAFVRYKLRSAVAVSDSFFIGYKQTAEGDLGIGLDKNTSSGNKMLFNLDGTWQQNTIVEGSLMLRPVFGIPPDDPKTGLPEKLETRLKVYPNPSTGVYKINGQFETLKVFDIRGVEQNFSLRSDGNDAILNLETQAEGLYILQFVRKERLETIKVFKKQ